MQQLIVCGIKVILPVSHFRSPCAHGPWFRLVHPFVECTPLRVLLVNPPRLTITTAIPHLVSRKCHGRRDPPSGLRTFNFLQALFSASERLYR